MLLIDQLLDSTEGGRLIYDYYLTAFGLEPIGNRPKHLVSSPFRSDRNPSLNLYFKGTVWRHYDFGESTGGHAMDFAARAEGLNLRNDYKELAARVQAKVLHAVVHDPGEYHCAQPTARKQKIFYPFQAGEPSHNVLDEWMRAHGNNWEDVCRAYGVLHDWNWTVFQHCDLEGRVRIRQRCEFHVVNGRLTKKWTKPSGELECRSRNDAPDSTVEWVPFGAHLINEHTKRVCLVEAADTALLCAMQYQEAGALWAACSGKGYRKLRSFMMEHPTIVWTIYPDREALGEAIEDANYLAGHGLKLEVVEWFQGLDFNGCEAFGINPDKADLKDWITLLAAREG